MQDGDLWRVDDTTGDDVPITTQNEWLGVTSLISDGYERVNYLGAYAIQDGSIWHLDLDIGFEGRRTLVSDADWTGPTQLAVGNYLSGGQWVNSLIAYQDGELYRVNPSTHAVSPLSNGTADWVGLQAMVYCNYNRDGDGNDLFAVQDFSLWRVNVNTGKFVRLLGNWGSTTAMTTDDTSLYIVSRNHLFKANPATGRATDLGGNWNSTTSLTYFEAGLFAIDGGNMYRVDRSTGSRTLIGGSGWWTAPALMTYRVEGR